MGLWRERLQCLWAAVAKVLVTPPAEEGQQDLGLPKLQHHRTPLAPHELPELRSVLETGQGEVGEHRETRADKPMGGGTPTGAQSNFQENGRRSTGFPGNDQCWYTVRHGKRHGRPDDRTGPGSFYESGRNAGPNPGFIPDGGLTDTTLVQKQTRTDECRDQPEAAEPGRSNEGQEIKVNPSRILDYVAEQAVGLSDRDQGIHRTRDIRPPQRGSRSTGDPTKGKDTGDGRVNFPTHVVNGPVDFPTHIPENEDERKARLARLAAGGATPLDAGDAGRSDVEMAENPAKFQNLDAVA